MTKTLLHIALQVATDTSTGDNVIKRMRVFCGSPTSCATRRKSARKQLSLPGS